MEIPDLQKRTGCLWKTNATHPRQHVPRWRDLLTRNPVAVRTLGYVIRSTVSTRASDQTLQLDPLPSAYIQGTRKYTAAGWLAALSLVSVASIVVYRVLQQRRHDMDVGEVQGEFLHANHLESEDFKDALASVRQVVTFQRAVQSMRAGDTARAMVELYRVLEQNAICRTPLNTASFSQDELEGIYRLHLQNSELPLQYATLLQLRQLLKIRNRQAEELEKALKGSAYQFSI